MGRHGRRLGIREIEMKKTENYMATSVDAREGRTRASRA